MMNFTDLPSAPSDHLVPFTDQLRSAVAAYLPRLTGSSRYHTDRIEGVAIVGGGWRDGADGLHRAGY
jgi:hypothetical protein